ncbi:MAG: hypothetical protein KAU48_11275 [Candidatus Thorarchaeota archaeon]|nr:hypothetical protein [Candidatus Thorarchaeota archaeon]
MSKIVKIGYANYLDEHGELTVLSRVELRVHVYREEQPDWEPPFWSVWHYQDEEGKERGESHYVRDFDTADLRFMDRRPLGMFTIRKECPKCNHMEAMYKYIKKELCCMSCGFEWIDS